MVGVGVVGVCGVGGVGRRSVSWPLTGPRHVVPLYGICRVLLSTMCAVPLIENGQDGKPGTEPVPVTVYGTSLPLICPDAVPAAEMPLAHVAENVPDSDVDVWLVTCHENPVHELAEMFESGFDVQVPIIEGADAAGAGAGAGVGVVLDEVLVALGARTFDVVCSSPVQAPVSAAAATMAGRQKRFMAVP